MKLSGIVGFDFGMDGLAAVYFCLDSSGCSDGSGSPSSSGSLNPTLLCTGISGSSGVSPLISSFSSKGLPRYGATPFLKSLFIWTAFTWQYFTTISVFLTLLFPFLVESVECLERLDEVSCSVELQSVFLCDFSINHL